MALGGKRKGAGRKKGVPNKFTGVLKEMILEAANQAGGEDGTVGYLRTQATANPGPFMALLGKVLPMQVTGEDGNAIAIIHRVEQIIVDPSDRST